MRVGEHRAVRPGIDERAGGPRRIVEQRLVPGRGGVVRVDGDGGGFERAQPVMIVQRIEQREMQDRRNEPRLLEAHGARSNRIFVCLRPTVRPRHDAHAVRPQRVEFTHRAVEVHRLDIAVAADQEIGGDRFKKARPVLARIGAREQGRERMLVERLRAFIDKEGERADILRHQLDRTMHDRIGDEALARERRIVARRPPRAARRRKLNQPRRARSLLLRRAEQPCNQILHVKAPNEGPHAT